MTKRAPKAAVKVLWQHARAMEKLFKLYGHSYAVDVAYGAAKLLDWQTKEGCHIFIQDIFCPALQREDDVSIMDYGRNIEIRKSEKEGSYNCEPSTQMGTCYHIGRCFQS